MASWQEHLGRWERADVIDASAAERVRNFESQSEAPAGQRWQVAVLLALGMILLGVG